jgi:ribosomal 30S subunit maturation factor RimM
LEGCTVKVGDDSIGQVKSVLKTGGVEILVVTGNSGKELLIPLADSIVLKPVILESFIAAFTTWRNEH